jgi:class 3 adenylate cyclase
MAIPQVRYAREGDLNLAYQVWGDGPVDLVLVWGTLSHCELFWEHPPMARFLEGLGRFARVIQFDKRGTGLSDRSDKMPTLEERMDDVRIVMQAAGSERAAIFGESEGSPMACLFAATFPDRVSHLVLFGPLVRMQNDDDFDAGWDSDGLDAALGFMVDSWGTGQTWALAAPSLFNSDAAGTSEFASRFERQALSPGALRTLMSANRQIDIRPVLPTIRTTTLVMHRTGDRLLSVEQGRYMAAHIPDAKYVELEGEDHYVAAGDVDAVLRETRAFITGADTEPDDVDRVLATVLFTDIVRSTETAAQLGDRKWTQVLDDHDRVVRSAVDQARGRLVKTTGDGALATFDGPARAVRAANAIVQNVRSLGIDVRAGVHTGEVELRGDDVGGIGVHIGARVSSLADAGQVLVSRTVVDLVVGSGLQFTDAGSHSLKGVPGEWQVFALASS